MKALLAIVVIDFLGLFCVTLYIAFGRTILLCYEPVRDVMFGVFLASYFVNIFLCMSMHEL
jgi:hypothetical protein